MYGDQNTAMPSTTTRNTRRAQLYLSLLLVSSAQSFSPTTATISHKHVHCNIILKVSSAPVDTANNQEDVVNGDDAFVSFTVHLNNSMSNNSSSRHGPFLPPSILQDNNVFDQVAARAALCLLESDLKRDAKHQKQNSAVASGATNWIENDSALRVRQALDQVQLQLPDARQGQDRDEASSWIRWIKSVPTPMMIHLSRELQQIANETLQQQDTSLLAETDYATMPKQFLSRLGCRLVVLPSGAPLDSALTEAPGSMIYGKLLFGGISRYRLLTSTGGSRPPRRTGERTEVKPSAQDDTPVWIQYGGSDRMYEAVDMGPAAVLEVIIMPRGQELSHNDMGENMVVGSIPWKPQQMFDFVKSPNDTDNSQNRNSDDNLIRGYTPISLSGKERNEAFQSDFQSAVGGLQPQIDAIVRRVLDGRVIRPAEVDSTGVNATTGDSTTTELALAAMEAEELSLLGLTPVRGLLMYGPPGCGKTALAREISRALRARALKIVSAPELLDRWVGGSEKLVRALFVDAETELAACQGDATKSALHVIVIDEIDAVFRKRSTAEDSGESTRSSVVNQILSKLDGVNAIPNVLLIGMTNRRELLDEALLRPGRLEVQIEIPLPNKEGRREILQIHFDALRKKGRLSKPLCCAIDGIPLGSAALYGQSVNENEAGQEGSTSFLVDDTLRNNKGRKRRAVKRAISKVVDAFPAALSRYNFDLAADSVTGGFSGADLAGLVRCAGSIALARSRKDGNGIEGILITLEDVQQALQELKE